LRIIKKYENYKKQLIVAVRIDIEKKKEIRKRMANTRV